MPAERSVPVSAAAASAGPGVPLPAGRGIHHLVAEHVAAGPQRCAVVDANGRGLTYAELWARSGALAAALAAHGVGRHDRVAVALDRSLDLVVALLAIARSAAAYVPLDPLAPAERLSYVIDEAQTRVVVGASEPGDWPLPNGLIRLTAGSEIEVAAPMARSVDPAPEPIDAADALYVAYTSGSTGEPKGVVVPHRAVLGLVTEPAYCPLRPGDRVAALANPAFDATTFEVWSTLAAGATIVILPPVVEISIGEWSDLLAHERVSAMFMTTAAFNVIARGEPTAFGSLETLLFGGEAADAEAVRRVLAAGPPRRLLNVYGPTETTTFATFFPCTRESIDGRKRIPIGFPLQNTTLRLLDDECRPVAPGETGELWIGGPRVALGYLHRPDLTARRFRPERSLPGGAAEGVDPDALVYRTGDRARRRADGAVEFLGRDDRQVKLRGFRIELEEIEAAIRATGLVEPPVVEMIGNGVLAHLVAFVTPAATPQTAGPADRVSLPDALAAALRDRLPGYMVPARWVVLDELPLTGTGKIDRARLVAGLDAGDSPQDSGDDVPRTGGGVPAASSGEPGAAEISVAVCEAARELLELPTVTPGDNFFDLGGNSIVAIQLAAALHERLHAEVTPTDVLLTGSLAELSDRVAAVRAESERTGAAHG